MAEIQYQEGDPNAPLVRHRAPSVQHATNGDETQLRLASSSLGTRLIGYLASIICLGGAVYYLWMTRDVLIFLLLIGVATGQIPIRWALNRRK